jgi:plasmid stability protein
MRTTLNLDDDVAARLRDLSREHGRSLSRTANELLREGLRSSQRVPAPDRYDPPTFDTGRPLVDVTDVAAVLEIIGDGP